jgi:NAD-dependent SIR2 family protein deacetylase
MGSCIYTGAGISTPAIPDFRSSTGLFKTLAKDPFANLGTSANTSEAGVNDAGEDKAELTSTASSRRGSCTGLGVGKRRKSEVGGTFRRTRSFNLAGSATRGEQGEEDDEFDETRSNGESGDDPDAESVATPMAPTTRKMTVGGVGGIRSGKDLFDVRCLSDPSLLPAHHSLLNTLHRLTQSTEPTLFHKYMKTLDEEGRLLRVYTQNIDGLEAKVGLDLRAPGDVSEGVKSERRWKRERSRRELQMGLEAAAEAARAQEAAEQQEPLVEQAQNAPVLEDKMAVKGYDRFPLCEPGSSRQSTPSRLSTTDEGGDSLSEAERIVSESERRSRSGTPQYALPTVNENLNLPDTPASARSVSSVHTDLSAQYGFLRTTPTKMEPIPDANARANALPRAVPLHGVLSTMDCTRCSYSQNFEAYYPLPADLLSCPSCEETQEERLAANQRARSVGVLRASVLLYNEPCKHDTAIGEIVEKDVLGVRKDDRPDLLIVAGTTLKIPGVIKIVKQLSNALRTNYPDEKTKARNRQRAANRKRKRKMRDEGLLPPDQASDEEDTETEQEDGDEFDVDNFPIRTILLNRDAPGKAWEDTFDVWVQGDLQDFMQSWVTHGPTPADVEGTMEWMWKKGARERNRLAKAKLSGAFGPVGSDHLSSTPADLNSNSLNSLDTSKRNKINLSNRSKAEKWMETQSYGWERPTYFSQLVTVSRVQAEGTKLNMSLVRRDSGVQEKIDEELELPLEEVEEEGNGIELGAEQVEEPENQPEMNPPASKKRARPKKVKPDDAQESQSATEKTSLAVPSEVSTQTAQPKGRGKKNKKELAPVVPATASGTTTSKKKSAGKKNKTSNPVLSFPVSKPGSGVPAEKEKKSKKKTVVVPFSVQAEVQEEPEPERETLSWDRLVEGSLSPAPSSECGEEDWEFERKMVRIDPPAASTSTSTSGRNTNRKGRISIDLSLSADLARLQDDEMERDQAIQAVERKEVQDESVRRSSRKRVAKRLSIG